ncbi:hypothetical protein M3J09_007954 [Ascochyta lentis]
MQFSLFLTGLLAGAVAAAPYANVFAACIPGQDCCFSTLGACKRQATFAMERNYECKKIDLCPALGVPLASCRADCCSISTKGGRGCPGK